MGIIACNAPGSNVSVPIPRKEVTYQESTDLERIQTQFFHEYKSEQSKWLNLNRCHKKRKLALVELMTHF
jgi:hypothetical protein